MNIGGRMKQLLKKINLNKYMLEGTYTVEAVHIVPLILLLFIFIIWYGFYLHDLIIMDSWTAYNAEEARMARQYSKKPYSKKVIHGGIDENDEDDEDDLIKAILDNQWKVNNYIMAGKGSEMTVRSKHSYVEADGKYTANMLILPNIYKIKLKGALMYSTRKVYKPDDVTRATSLVYRIYKKMVNKE
jgi:hypothetical protein